MSSNVFRLAIAIALLASLPFMADGSSAESEDYEVYYCYGDSPILIYPYSGDDIRVVWSAVDLEGNSVVCYPDTGYQTAIQLTGLDKVIVTQTVTQGSQTASKTIVLIGLHMFVGDAVNDSFTVTFLDGDTVVSKETINRKTVVKDGEFHVAVPLDPVSDDLAFGGWFVDESCTQLFDPFDPIYGDTNVYAKWTGSSSTVVPVSTFLVTFEAVNGIAYKIDRIVGSAVYFTVKVVPGFNVDLNSISVHANGGRLTQLGDGSYLLDNVRKNITVTIDAEYLNSIEYRFSHMSASFGGSPDLPTGSFSGKFDLQLNYDFGWSSVKITVLMGGVDITDQCVDGESIHIDRVTGDLVIIASADFPLLYVVVGIILIIALAAVILILHFRRVRSCTKE